ncbi:GNAT family N-acetyltransferase [Winogradskyella thalassocola]|uniref:Acetyltransferase (GNAT) family protein n=1 Tax=Winogradskyella thalassocola TaxID=262004 RepID=A0A1G8BQP2_9FLAO|nr:GNAT family N-acetyltransferase [Winogradskyella thalassocola]SDH35408.1 Acetyltransferase (GNAT) family protein [Winogradskyella thalassocola]
MIKIAKASIEHSELIAEIGKISFFESHGNSASAEDINSFISKTYNKETISKEFENAKAQYHLIYFNDKVAGFSKIELSTSNKDIDELDVTKLDRIYLLKEFYGQGLGSKLFDFNIELSKKQNQKGIWLAVWVENQRAISFYTKIGFQIAGKYDFKISETRSNPNHIMFLKYE